MTYSFIYLLNLMRIHPSSHYLTVWVKLKVGWWNFLQLNDSKTEVLVFGRPDFANTLSNTLAPITNTVGSHARNLGVIFDPALKFDKQIHLVVKSAFFQLRMIAKIESFISFKDLETVIHAFISSRLDYCNSLYLGVAILFVSPSVGPKFCGQICNKY